MKRLATLAVVSAVVGFTLTNVPTVDAWPYYDSDLCYYGCGDDTETVYVAPMSYQQCCTAYQAPCPNGQYPNPYGWGGYTTYLDVCG